MSSPARRLRDSLEPFHSICYFAPELARPYTERGLHPWMSYFGQRAAPMGAVGAATVTAVFYGFSPELVAQSVPAVWDSVSPEEAWDLRMTGVDAALHRLLGERVDDPTIGEAAELARSAALAVPAAGRPLGSAHAAMPVPATPLLTLWWAVSSLREQRGDGHVAALVTHGVGAVESMVTAGDFSNLSPGFHRKRRGWQTEAWTETIARCRRAGWIDDDGTLTTTGRDLRERIEAATDVSMQPALDAIGPDGTQRLSELVGSLSRTVTESGGFG